MLPSSLSSTVPVPFSRRRSGFFVLGSTRTSSSRSSISIGGRELAYDLCLFLLGQLRIERQRHREPVGNDAIREVLGPQPVTLRIERGEDRGMGPLPGGDPLLLERCH